MIIKLKPIIRKITIIGDNFSFSFIEDKTNYAASLVEISCNGFSEQNIYNYFAEGEFKSNEIEDLNSKHFLYDFIEDFVQSERCPDMLYIYTGDLKFKVEIMEEL
ncbi:hypothetical protein [Alkaliphilus sp. B6464]|uniref:hypothetical protein n=1 Tax=Alkaliphilus sp. B6464 TaxID=2731219 RepID=UPI001BA7587F|nr:hypothetical protein [Alkaliphilus sp. B6464]QUH21819.1 hypothetical protein HYG84_17945 [Alkaliphilus sp. B6464]